MKPAAIVIGSRNAGKSTVIRSLTGCPKKGFSGVVEDRVTHRKIFTIAASPQEQPLDLKEFRTVLAQVAEDDSILGLVMAVQPSRPRLRLSLEDIIRAIKGNTQFDVFAILLDPPYDSSGGVDLNDLGGRLKALDVKLHLMDGRRFALLSAVEIRGIIGLP